MHVDTVTVNKMQIQLKTLCFINIHFFPMYFHHNVIIRRYYKRWREYLWVLRP